MRDVSAKAHIGRLIDEQNYVGAYLYLKEAEVDTYERTELTGSIVTSIVTELGKARREDRERIYYLRSLLAWIFRDVPGLASLYREQLRESRPGTDLLGGMLRGFQNVGDVASGRKSVQDGFNDVAEDARRNLEDAVGSMKSGEAGDRVNDFLKNAEKGLKDGLSQLGDFFKALNEREGSDTDDAEDAAAGAARARAGGDVEDADIVEDDSDDATEVNIERD